MLIRTDEKSVTLTPFGSLALGSANASRGGGQSWDRNSPHGAFSSYPKPFRKPAPSGLAFAPGCRRFAALDPMWRAQSSSASRVADRWHDWWLLLEILHGIGDDGR